MLEKIVALNIINSTSMSVSARTKQYGAMRAVGMDGRQLTKMIVAEVFTHAFFGCFTGCAVGLPLNKLIFERFITAYFGEVWRVPVGMLIIILLVMFGAAAILYVNGKYRGSDEIGKLMHDFSCTNPDDMNYEALAKKSKVF